MVASYTETAIPNFRDTLRYRNEVTIPVTVLSGQDIAKGDVLGVQTTGGKAIKSVPTATDGSQVPVGIAHIAVDATGGDVNAEIIGAGEVDYDDLSTAATTAWTHPALLLALQDRGIVLFRSVADSTTGVV